MKLDVLNTELMSSRLRERGINVAERKVLITNFMGTSQAQDLTEPPNCEGVGRIRHFKRSASKGWPINPLPIDPARRRFPQLSIDEVRAEVFQNAVCNWRCWYCFVDFASLCGSERRSQWLTAEDLVERYLAVPHRPQMIDLSGGQPDLTPEWASWMLDALIDRGLDQEVYLWSDDNLSNDYFWQFLNERQRRTLADHRMYSRVCCFKGFDAEAFSFNTRAEPALFETQFGFFRRLLDTGMDLYGYVTLTGPRPGTVTDGVRRFIDHLQEVDENLPLRVVPLEIRVFTPMVSRMDDQRRSALDIQWRAIEVWTNEIAARFSPSLRNGSICDVRIGPRTI